MYELTLDAEEDIRDIARYTLNTWGKDIFSQYQIGLKKVFNSLAKNSIKQRQFSKQYPDLYVTKYKYHFIFYLLKNLEKPVIIAIIHERRDIVKHLDNRLNI